MPLPNPILDDRSYQQLRDELVRRIPVYTPEWTDYNASDPGITLLELFAFLGENLLYRFNQMPETAKLAFLRLLDIPLRPATPARAMVTMTTEAAAGALVELNAEAKAGQLSFETLQEVKVWPVSFVAVGKGTSAAPVEEDEPEVFDFAMRAVDALDGLAEGQEPAFYENRVVPAEGAGLPVDFDATVDRVVWVAVVGEKNAEKEKLGDALLNLGFVPDPVVPSMPETTPCPGAGAGTKGPAVEWQVSTGEVGLDGAPRYRALAVEADTTRGLSQEGVVRLRLPKKHEDFGVFEVDNEDLLGTGQFPPSLDEETAPKVLFWMRAFRRDGTGFGKVLFVGANAAEVCQTKRARPEFLGTGTGQPGQSFALVHKPVIEGSLSLEVEEFGGWRAWTSVEGFYASAPDDRHYVVDLEAGRVTFGTGVQGLPPQTGQRVRVTEYRYGGGDAGNVAPKALSKLSDYPSVKVSNPLRAHGGAAGETIDAALERIPGELRRRDRAVTAGDFQELALATPGAGVGRAECLARFHPPSLTPERAGVVSVVVWPREDPARPNAPLPDRNLLRAVCEWLDMRRLVTTELYVIPPTYRKVAVSVGLKVKPGYGVEAVRRWVELVLRQYLAPLPPYGPAGGGWPLGRRVHGPELEAVALQVEGVEFLEDLKVAGWDGAASEWKPGTVELEMYEVPELEEISVVDGADVPDAGEALGPPAPSKVPVPIPIIREEC